LPDKELSRPEWVSAVLDAIPAEIAVLNRQAEIIYVNREWRRFAEQNEGTSACLLGTNYVEICRRSASRGDKSAGEVADSIEGILSGEKRSFNCEYPCDTPEGRRWFKLLLSSTVENGERFVIVQHIDVTDRIEAEDRYRLVVESVAEGIVLSDQKGKILAVNTAGENLFARTREWITERQMRELLPGLDAEPGMHVAYEYEGGMQGPQTLNVSCFPFEDTTGRYYVWTVSDVSAQKREAVNEERERMLAAESMLKVGTVVMDRGQRAGLIEKYQGLLDAAPQAAVFEEQSRVLEKAAEFAAELRQLRVDPHDFVRLHTEALTELQRGTVAARSRALAEEARLLLLRILADLGSLYHREQLLARAQGQG
jgi:PAS domain S-box-containing protein